ncbi:MAG: hypothetical protein COU69_04645 [Candidatus Pacebacteria bacterium CG10_big_fil_rev_8_21_14_0_10_56_10]|nr:MAG: hypothetical protein COU69_04645 [Candidatus Pacebacteria bacterium CG10_big_fil_rev_8_21_14_0_10_56_10]
MLNPDTVAQLAKQMADAGTVMVVLRSRPSLDQTAAATALRLSLTASDRQADLVAPEPLVSETADDLIGIDQVKTELGNKHLSISFEYDEQAVDKVSYHIDEDEQRFYLLIKPRRGHRPLDASKVSFAYTGAEADLVFLVGVHSLESLGQLYIEYQDFFTQTTSVVLHRFEPEIGQYKFDSSGMSSLSELTLRLLESLELPIDSQVATNLLAGVEDSTDGFRSATATAETFECVARLMRYGARRLPRRATPSVDQTERTASRLDGPAAYPGIRLAGPSGPLAEQLRSQAQLSGSLADKMRRPGQAGQQDQPGQAGQQDQLSQPGQQGQFGQSGELDFSRSNDRSDQTVHLGSAKSADKSSAETTDNRSPSRSLQRSSSKRTNRNSGRNAGGRSGGSANRFGKGEARSGPDPRHRQKRSGPVRKAVAGG